LRKALTGEIAAGGKTRPYIQFKGSGLLTMTCQKGFGRGPVPNNNQAKTQTLKDEMGGEKIPYPKIETEKID